MHLNLNGELISADQPHLMHSNRAFRYGDGIFESMRMFNGRLPFLQYHVDRLDLSMQLLKLEPTTYFSVPFFEREITTLAKANKITNGRIRLSVFRGDGGLYKPATNDAHFLIEMSSLDSDRFILNGKGKVVDVYPTHFKDTTRLANIKSTNAQVYVLASIFAEEEKLDDAFVLNNMSRIIEATSSNLLVYKDGILLTPAHTEGCVSGIMKEIIISIALQMNIEYKPALLNEEDLEGADELLLSNAVQGVQWVGKFREQFYTNDLAHEIIEKLNQQVEQQ